MAAVTTIYPDLTPFYTEQQVVHGELLDGKGNEQPPSGNRPRKLSLQSVKTKLAELKDIRVKIAVEKRGPGHKSNQTMEISHIREIPTAPPEEFDDDPAFHVQTFYPQETNETSQLTIQELENTPEEPPVDYWASHQNELRITDTEVSDPHGKTTNIMQHDVNLSSDTSNSATANLNHHEGYSSQENARDEKNQQFSPTARAAANPSSNCCPLEETNESSYWNSHCPLQDMTNHQFKTNTENTKKYQAEDLKSRNLKSVTFALGPNPGTQGGPAPDTRRQELERGSLKDPVYAEDYQNWVKWRRKMNAHLSTVILLKPDGDVELQQRKQMFSDQPSQDAVEKLHQRAKTSQNTVLGEKTYYMFGIPRVASVKTR